MLETFMHLCIYWYVHALLSMSHMTKKRSFPALLEHKLYQFFLGQDWRETLKLFLETKSIGHLLSFYTLLLKATIQHLLADEQEPLYLFYSRGNVVHDAIDV